MRTLNRRNFMKSTVHLAAGLSAGALAPPLISLSKSGGLNMNEVTATVPMPIQVVIDDVGWWSGRDGSKQQEPYRTGIPRNHFPEDYAAIVQLGRSLGIRPQAALILCEWDRNNILRKLPSSTWMGPEWDNRKWVGPWLDKAAEIIANHSENIEITLHGIGHEYWIDGKFTRAEWADTSGIMRPLDQVEAHLDAYAAIMRQNQLGPFPRSFVPTAFLHGFGPTGEHRQSLAEILKPRGIEYINTPFDNMRNREAVDPAVFGFDAGVITIDRGQDLLPWDTLGAPPSGELRGPTCGMHWPNLLHLDPAHNSESVEAWVHFLRPFQDSMETLLAPDSESFRTQLIHHYCTQLQLADEGFQIDFTKVDVLSHPLKRQELTVKMKSPWPVSIKSDDINISLLSSIKKDGTFLSSVNFKRTSGEKVAIIKVLPQSGS
jgi:hypothetical protein